MKNFKVPHDSNGDHHPFPSIAVLTDPYEFNGTLKFEGIDVGRNLTTIQWLDTVTNKRYHSYVYLLTAILTGQMNDEAEISFSKGGLFVTARFGFEQRGEFVLLEVFPPEAPTVDKEMALDHAKVVFEAVISGKYSLRQLKTEARGFLKYLNKGKEAEENE
jgi:hypothetical protein